MDATLEEKRRKLELLKKQKQLAELKARRDALMAGEQQTGSPIMSDSETGNAVGMAAQMLESGNMPVGATPFGQLGAAPAELALTMGTGFASQIEGLYDGMIAAFAEDDENYDKAIDQAVQQGTYMPRSKGTNAALDLLSNVGEAVMYAPSMLYAGIKNLPSYLTATEREVIEDQMQADRQRFAEAPNRAIAKDVQTLTGSEKLAATTETGLFVLEALFGARSPKHYADLQKQSQAGKLKRYQDTIKSMEENGALVVMQRDLENPKKPPVRVTPFMLEQQGDLTPMQRAELGQYVKESSAAKEAIKQGLNDRDVAFFSSIRPQDKPAIKRMLQMARKMRKDLRYQNQNSLLDVVGEGLTRRYRFIKSKNLQAGRNIDKYVKQNANKPVNFEPVVDRFLRDLQEQGVRVDNQGTVRLDFSNSPLQDSDAAMRYITTVVNRMTQRGGDTLREGHELKRFLDEGKDLPEGGAALTKKSRRVIEKLRSRLNREMGDADDGYRKLNTQYSETIDVLNKFQQAVGKNTPLSAKKGGIEATLQSKALGQEMRKLFSNYKSANFLKELSMQADRISGKYGAQFDDSLFDQALAAIEIRDMFDLEKSQTFQKQIRAGLGQRVVEAQTDPTITAAREAAGAFDKYLYRPFLNVNDEAALKAIEDLLDE